MYPTNTDNVTREVISIAIDPGTRWNGLAIKSKNVYRILSLELPREMEIRTYEEFEVFLRFSDCGKALTELLECNPDHKSTELRAFIEKGGKVARRKNNARGGRVENHAELNTVIKYWRKWLEQTSQHIQVTYIDNHRWQKDLLPPRGNGVGFQSKDLKDLSRAHASKIAPALRHRDVHTCDAICILEYAERGL